MVLSIPVLYGSNNNPVNSHRTICLATDSSYSKLRLPSIQELTKESGTYLQQKCHKFREKTGFHENLTPPYFTGKARLWRLWLTVGWHNSHSRFAEHGKCLLLKSYMALVHEVRYFLLFVRIPLHDFQRR